MDVGDRIELNPLIQGTKPTKATGVEPPDDNLLSNP